MQDFNLKKFTAKLLLFTEDGKSFICVNQYYIQDLERDQKVDGSPLQGKRFRLIEDKANEQGE